MEQKMVGHFLKWWAQAYQTYHSWHWGNILYLHTDTDIKTCLMRPLKKDQLSLNAGQKYCRLLQGSILQSFWPSLSYHMFSRLAERWIFLLVRFFHILKRWVHWAHCFGKWWAISWNHGTMTRAHHKSEGLHVCNKIAFILFRIKYKVKKCERKIQIYGKIKVHIFSNAVTKLDRIYHKTKKISQYS